MWRIWTLVATLGLLVGVQAQPNPNGNAACIFSVMYHDLSSFQVEGGTILDHHLVVEARAGAGGLCDERKVSVFAFLLTRNPKAQCAAERKAQGRQLSHM